MNIIDRIKRDKSALSAQRENCAKDAEQIGKDLIGAKDRQKSANLEVERIETKYKAQMLLYDKYTYQLEKLDELVDELNQ